MSGRLVSYAYLSDTSGWDKEGDDVASVDFLSSDQGDLEVVGRKALERLRVARCSKMTKLVVKDCPNLVAVDCALATELKGVSVVNCPRLRALDVSFCDGLRELSGTFESLEYLSMPYTRLQVLPRMPNLKYIDCTHCNGHFLPTDFPKIEVFYGLTVDKGISLSELTRAKSLKKASIRHTSVTLNSTAWFSKLQWLSLRGCEVIGDVKAVKKVYFLDARGDWNGCVHKKHNQYAYLSAHLELYGPWAVPPVDAEEWSLPPPMELVNPPEFDAETKKAVVDAMVGCLFGQGMGDMLGVGCEFQPKPDVGFLVQEDLGITWTHPVVSDHTASFVRGTATDDTSQAVLIMRMLVRSKGTVNLQLFAELLLEWLKEGHKEHRHGGGLGAGSTTRAVMNHEDFLTDPVKAAYATWEKMNKDAASNGAVMRTSPCGCLQFWNEDFVIDVAKLCASATHSDPRCIFSSVAISLLISRILQQRAGLIKSLDIDETIRYAISKVENLEPYMNDINSFSTVTDIEQLHLGEQPIGYTLKTYGAAVWALRYCHSFEEAIQKVVLEGGDTDTNAAVVGALVGAKFGFRNLPKKVMTYMFEGAWLLREIEQYIALMGYDCKQMEIPFRRK